MRVLIAAALLIVPLSGCIGGIGLIESDLFDYIQVERGDPTPVAFDTCQDLLDTLNLRAEQRALVDLHQSYEGQFYHGGGRGGLITVEDSAGSSDGATAPQAAGEASFSARDADVTGTNVQEQGVDEADVIKTDGEWTYAVDGQLLHILHSETVGNLSLYHTIDLSDGEGDGYGYGHNTQIFLIDRGNDDPADDRLVVIRSGVQGPDEKDPEQAKSSGRAEPSFAADIAYYPYYGGRSTNVQVYDLSDRSDPERLAQHFVEGDNVGARLVDGVAYLVIHKSTSFPYYGYAEDGRPIGLVHHADAFLEPVLKDEGMTWEQYYEAGENRRKELLLQSVERAVDHNDDILADMTLADHLPTMYHPDGSNVSEREFTSAYCNSVLTTPDDMGRSVTTILSLDADDDALPFATKQILGGYPLVYGAQGALVLASSSQEHWWFWAQPSLDEATNLHWFDLDGLDVEHRASGRVDGIVQDQFGIDVHDGQLRVATTTGTWGRWWLEDPEPMLNHVAIFQEVGGLLVEQGRVGDIAPDERLWSARFTDDRAYLITFEQIDPLWIIDLSDPTDPQILGELEIPGVSTYIHPLPGEDALLTIGIGPRTNGDGEEVGLDWSRIQVSLFDISDPTNPVRADVMDVTLPGEDEYSEDGSYSTWSWGYSAALHEHKAFTYWHDLGMLAIPVSWQHEERSCSGPSNDRTCVHRSQFHTGLDLIQVDADNMALTKYGSVDQDRLMTDEGENEGRYWGAEVQRSYFLGFPDEYPDKPVSVYAYSPIGMSAHDLETLEDQDAVRFQGGGYTHYKDDDGDQPLLDDVTDSVGGTVA